MFKDRSLFSVDLADSVDHSLIEIDYNCFTKAGFDDNNKEDSSFDFTLLVSVPINPEQKA